jgi:hypothetical protein
MKIPYLDWGRCLRFYATSRKVMGSSLDEAIAFFFNLPNPSSSGVYPASNRNEYQKTFLGVKGGRSIRLTT